ncbi:DUF1292 domain-containing protein [Clostridium paraputrificum]|uniref:DUF1292 domain-containing protein n=1 Tax=Clostridium paraputrificum TaxID=29363 RepID=UPI003D33CDCA
MDKELNKCGCGHDHEGCGHDHDHDHEGCGCGEHESFVIDLEDENGNVVSCPIIDAFEYEGTEYVLAQNQEDESVYMFRAEGEELVVPEEAEFEKVAAYYNDELVEK